MLNSTLIINGTTIESFLTLIEEKLDKRLSNHSNLPSSAFSLEYVNDYYARCILAGNPDKPISKKIFNKLRSDGRIITYHPSEGRTAYKVSNLYTYIESTKSRNL